MIPASDATDLSPVFSLSDLVFFTQKDTLHLDDATLDGKPVWPGTRKRELLLSKDMGVSGGRKAGRGQPGARMHFEIRSPDR